MEVSLVLIGKNGSQREIALKKPRIVIGRQTDCQVRIPLASVSRQHCEVRMDGGKPVIQDLKSRNGTYVNRKRVESAALAAGDLVNIGPFVFVVRVGGQPKQIDGRKAMEGGMIPADAAALADGGTQTALSGAGDKRSSGLLEGLSDLSDSSIVEFDFTDEDDAPKL